MNIAIVSNLDSGIGLLRDYELLREYLESCGHEVYGVQYDVNSVDLKADLAIFLEVCPRTLMSLAPRRWLFANPEWMKHDKIQIVQQCFEKVFAKTHEAKRVLDPVFPGRVHYTGFLARDQFDASVKRQRWFLHVGGNSTIRGTQTLVDAFKWKKDGKPLDAHVVIVSSALKTNGLPLNIVHLEKVDEKYLKHLQNQCMFHIYPSATEGFGHAIHEGQSTGAVVIIPDAPPMNELRSCYTIPAVRAGKQGLADLYEVSALDLYEAVRDLENHYGGLIEPMEPRISFEADNEEFKENFAMHLAEAPVIAVREKHKDRKSIAFIGNFDAEHSTENQILWALEQRLGFQVDKLQENKVGYSEICEAVNFADALIWVKTPGWLQIDNTGNRSMVMILNECTHLKIPTISIHLDKFFGIPAREEEVGMHAFWRTDDVWTADGSPQAAGFFRSRGVRHHWMKPAVSEVYCHPGIFREQHECDVCFVGAKTYHKEYPFREQLINFLEAEYGDRFKHVQGIRGHELNDVYASAKIVVGDCIFAGTPNYWSDRVPETVGRFGNLIHPSVEGQDTPLWLYEAQNLQNLKDMVTIILGMRPDFVTQQRWKSASYIKRHHTWTIRMREILETAQLL